MEWSSDQSRVVVGDCKYEPCQTRNDDAENVVVARPKYDRTIVCCVPPVAENRTNLHEKGEVAG